MSATPRLRLSGISKSYPGVIANDAITYHFPAKGDRGPVKMVWYDGGKLPPRPEALDVTRQLGDNGIYFVGDKGCILAGGWSGTPRIVPESKMQQFVIPAKTIPRCPLSSSRPSTKRTGSMPAGHDSGAAAGPKARPRRSRR